MNLSLHVPFLHVTVVAAGCTFLSDILMLKMQNVVSVISNLLGYELRKMGERIDRKLNISI